MLAAENSEQAGCWVEFYKYLLMNGLSDHMLERLSRKAESAKNQTPIRELYSYFDTRRERIKYDSFIAKGYPNGSHIWYQELVSVISGFLMMERSML